MKRRYEVICREGFDTFLASKFPHFDRDWHEPQTDPPDWFLTIGDTMFAVEATSITEQLSVGQEDPLPSPAVMTALARFVDEIEQAASDKGILSGAYMVSLAPIPNLREHKDELLSRFLGYISDTKNLPSPPEHSLGFIRNNHVSIVKIHSKSSCVAELISVCVKFGLEAQEELNAYLVATIAAKRHKLQDVSEPLVLLILDAYYCSDLADWRLAIMGIPERQAFRAIARVSPSDGTDVIWSTDEWLDA